jgi:two-component system, LytTR family, sensor kinase
MLSKFKEGEILGPLLKPRPGFSINPATSDAANVTDGILYARWGKWVLFILGWAALTLLFTPEAYLYFYLRRQPIPWRETFQLTLVNSAIALLFLPAIVWLTRRFPVERKSWPKALLVHIPACLLFSMGHSFLYWTACYASNQLGETLFFRFHPNLLTYWAIVGFTQAVDYFHRYTLRERELANAQLLLLKSQLHPHFLFNSLNTISAMMREDLGAADRMLSRLGDLLRLTIDSIGQHEITLKQELDFVQRYVEIERMRFQERITLQIKVGPDLHDALVPTMILQPLVENAIRHGFGANRNIGTVRIEAERDGDKLALTVIDSGRGFPTDVLAGQLNGLGLVNSERRLEQLYGAWHKLECSNLAEGGAAVRIEIPFHTSAVVQSGELISDENASVDRRRRALGAKANRYAAQT